MPQISKIRIVNFYYNNGKRFIADELYDLENEKGEALNTLFNLNNGGGKTVLVQLMMQPVNPRAMAGGRRIEDYFERSADHSFVLIEWIMDESRERLMTGIAIAASSVNSSDDNERGNRIRYYTFKSVYEDYSPYSIANLELSKNENGRFVPAGFEFVKDKGKQSKGALLCYSSDDARLWEKELSDYGILRSEWENVIETLNKDEGGLNEYFGDAKTSDKLISKFFIPAIEKKIKSVGNNTSDGSLGTMLISYAKKITEKESVMRERDINRELLTELRGTLDESRALFAAADAFAVNTGKVRSFKAAISKRTAEIESEKAKFEAKINSLNERIHHIAHEEKSKDFYIASDNLEIASEAYKASKEKYDDCDELLKNLRKSEDILNAAKICGEIREKEAEIKELKKLIEEKENNSEDAERIAALKFSVLLKAKEKEEKESAALNYKKNELDTVNAEYEKNRHKEHDVKEILEKAKEESLKAEISLKETKKTTDNLVQKFSLNVNRRLDGFYEIDEIEEERANAALEKETLEKEKRHLSNELERIERLKEELPARISDNMLESQRKDDEKRNIEQEIKHFDVAYEKIIGICNKYNFEPEAVWNGNLCLAAETELKNSRAKYNKAEKDKAALNDMLTAAKNGCLHILPEIMEYIRSTGIYCITGEDYLCRQSAAQNITKERLDKILDEYPEIAYSVLFDTEKDLKRFLEAGNSDWTQSCIPLFTMERVNLILKGEFDRAEFFACCDREYFAAPERFSEKKEEEISELEGKIKRYAGHISECEKDIKEIQGFCYDKNWKKTRGTELLSLEASIEWFADEIKRLEAELDGAKKQYKVTKRLYEEAGEKIANSEKRLEGIADVILNIDCENNLFDTWQKCSGNVKNAENAFEMASDAVKKSEKQLDDLNIEISEINRILLGVKEILKKVSGAKPVKNEKITDGETNELYSRYLTLCENLSKDLEALNEKLNIVNKRKSDAERELKNYKNCQREEYENIQFSAERMEKIKDDIIRAEGNLRGLREEFDKCKSEFITCTEKKKGILENLPEFGGEPLTKNEIGDNFKGRILEAKNEINNVANKEKRLDSENTQLSKVEMGVNFSLETEVPENEGELPVTVLSRDVVAEWNDLKRDFDNSKDNYFSAKDKLMMMLRDTKAKFDGRVLIEITTKLSDILKLFDCSGVKKDRLKSASEGILAMTDSVSKINSRIETDLKEIENDFNDIINQCMNQGRRMYHDLRAIAMSSKAQVFANKPQVQMLKLDLPEENALSEEAGRTAIEEELTSGANEIRDMLIKGAEECEILKRANKIVSSERLLHKYIKKDSIAVKVYKIDMTSENSGYKRWEEALTENSGAEKFVVFFAVVLTLMNYTRAEAGVVNKRAKSVLVLDNPFGKITSAHLLKPMFDIARHFNVQLICLSDINKSDVTNCFECVIKLVIKSQSLSNFEIMTHAGNEMIEHGFYKVMNGQMSLF